MNEDPPATLDNLLLVEDDAALNSPNEGGTVAVIGRELEGVGACTSWALHSSEQ